MAAQPNSSATEAPSAARSVRAHPMATPPWAQAPTGAGTRRPKDRRNRGRSAPYAAPMPVGRRRWTHASLALDQRGWPGTTRSDWVAADAAGERFRSPDVLEAMDRLGAEGWELVAFFPESGDRPAAFYFRAAVDDGPSPGP